MLDKIPHTFRVVPSFEYKGTSVPSTIAVKFNFNGKQYGVYLYVPKSMKNFHALRKLVEAKHSAIEELKYV